MPDLARSRIIVARLHAGYFGLMRQFANLRFDLGPGAVERFEENAQGLGAVRRCFQELPSRHCVTPVIGNATGCLKKM